MTSVKGAKIVTRTVSDLFVDGYTSGSVEQAFD